MEDALEGEEMLSSVVLRDTGGCVAKLMCQLLRKKADSRTLQEDLLLGLFINNKDVLASVSTFLVNDPNIVKSPSKMTCDVAFPKCPKTELELESFLQET